MASLFWNDVKAEPKRRYRFELSFTSKNGNSEGDIPVWTIKTANKPKANVSTISHTYVDHEFKYPGRVTWDPISVTLVDPVHPDLSYSFLDILGMAGYKYPNTPTRAKQSISKNAFKDAVGSIKIKQLGPSGEEIEVWELVNPFITSVDFGGALDYTSDDLNEITVEITFDWAKLLKHGGGKTNPTAAAR
jgi:hypothetical protein